MFFRHIIQPQLVLKNDLEYIISGCFELVFLLGLYFKYKPEFNPEQGQFNMHHMCCIYLPPTPPQKSQIHAQSSTPEAEFYRLKSARRAEVVLALHHIEEDGNGILPELRLWHQRDLQDGADHGGDKLHFVRA